MTVTLLETRPTFSDALRRTAWLFTLCALFVSINDSLIAQVPRDRKQAVERMKQYDGPSRSGVDRSTLTGKIMVGYQGWFNAPGDGSAKGWVHYGIRGAFKPGQVSVDLWPDVTELDDDEKFATPFKHRDGSTAYVFSSHKQKTVVRHFKWMQQYGIDGAFVQRFATQTRSHKNFYHCNTVLEHCRRGANQYGRAYAVMYDLSGLRRNQIQVVKDDWKTLVDHMGIGRSKSDKAYLHHKGRPVVAVWGIGFKDGRQYTLDECGQLIEFLKNDKKYGGFTVMIGVPSYWRTLKRDAVSDKKLHQVMIKADIISPWTIGRYRNPKQVERHATEVWQPDIAWCKARGKEYLPVTFPGFSWHNMKPQSKINEIPRLKGQFLWKQFVEARKAGATMIYQAMFDEIDEGTAIFKATNNPPVEKTKFLTYEQLPSDHYLWLTGKGAVMLRRPGKPREQMPSRQKD